MAHMYKKRKLLNGLLDVFIDDSVEFDKRDDGDYDDGFIEPLNFKKKKYKVKILDKHYSKNKNMITLFQKESPQVIYNNTVLLCKNKNCDHIKSNNFNKLFMEKIENIQDLVKLGYSYHCKNNLMHNGINLRLLFNLIEPLKELSSMVGLDENKKLIVKQILLFLKGFCTKNKCEKCIDCYNGITCVKNINDMLHTIIVGPPGTGKTEFAKILGKIYKELGVLKVGHFTTVKGHELIGKYIGHTAPKTQKKIDECANGIMFIDEAYQVGNSKGDSYSKECLDVLNQNLSERRDFLCIIAGYENSLENSFFNANEGLKRRFTFKYVLDTYSAKELMEIFKLKIKNDEWDIFDDKYLESFMLKNISYFPYFGGDIETFVLKCKMSHVFNSQNNDKIISNKDIDDGFKEFKKMRIVDTKSCYDMYI